MAALADEGEHLAIGHDGVNRLRLDELRPRPAPAWAEGIDGQVKTTGGVCLDGDNNGRMAVQVRADCRNHALGWLRKGIQFHWRWVPWRRDGGGGTVVRFSTNLNVIRGMSAIRVMNSGWARRSSGSDR